MILRLTPVNTHKNTPFHFSYSIHHSPTPGNNTSPFPLHFKPTAKRLGSSLPLNHKETQPFLHAVQRSADGSSNSRETTQPHILNRTPTPPLYPHTLNLTARAAISTSRLETPAGKACAVWRRLCRRGADS